MDILTWDITIPVNTKATVYIPAAMADDVKEGNNTMTGSDGIRFIKMEKENAVFEIGSGSYSFTSKSSINKQPDYEKK